MIRGDTPYSEWVPPGTYELKVLRTGYAPHTARVTVFAGASVDLQVVLAAIKKAPAPGKDEEEEEEEEEEPIPPEEEPPDETESEEVDPAKTVADKDQEEPTPAAIAAEDGGMGLGTMVAFAGAGVALVAGVVLGGLSLSKAAEHDDYVEAGREAGNTRT